MGCTACKGSKGVKQETQAEKVTVGDDHEVSNPPIVTTTLTTSSPSAGSTPAATSSPKAANKNGMSTSAQDDGSDDEIEVIYEEGPKKSAQKAEDPQLSQIGSAANGQEPPDAYEPESRPKPKQAFEAFGISEPIVAAPVEKPLSKAQQEEAAKLAERRQKFEEKRYQREAVEKERRDHDMILKDLEEDLGVGSAQKKQDPTPKMYKPLPTRDQDLIMGLNHNQHRTNNQPDAFAGLPGGIIDDFETLNVSSKAPQKKNNHHGFDAEDEQLMADILQDIEDL